MEWRFSNFGHRTDSRSLSRPPGGDHDWGRTSESQADRGTALGAQSLPSIPSHSGSESQGSSSSSAKQKLEAIVQNNRHREVMDRQREVMGKVELLLSLVQENTQEIKALKSQVDQLAREQQSYQQSETADSRSRSQPVEHARQSIAPAADPEPDSNSDAREKQEMGWGGDYEDKENNRIQSQGQGQDRNDEEESVPAYLSRKRGLTALSTGCRSGSGSYESSPSPGTDYTGTGSPGDRDHNDCLFFGSASGRGLSARSGPHCRMPPAQDATTASSATGAARPDAGADSADVDADADADAETEAETGALMDDNWSETPPLPLPPPRKQQPDESSGAWVSNEDSFDDLPTHNWDPSKRRKQVLPAPRALLPTGAAANAGGLYANVMARPDSDR